MLNPENPFKSEYENSQIKLCMEKIKEKISLMKNNQFCTLYSKLIEYFEENNFQPLIQEKLIAKILKEYNSNPDKFILPNNKGKYKSEKFFKKSVEVTISNNKIFKKGPNIGQLSLNLGEAKNYLDNIYKKNEKNVKDIMSPNKKPNSNKEKPRESILKNNNKGKNNIDSKD